MQRFMSIVKVHTERATICLHAFCVRKPLLNFACNRWRTDEITSNEIVVLRFRRHPDDVTSKLL